MPIYNAAKAQSGLFDWNDGAQTFRVLLATASYTPNVDHDFVDDVVANEATGTGYVRKDLAGLAVAIDTGNDRADHDADNLTWTGLTSTFRYAVIYRFITSDAASPLIAYVDLGAQTLTAQDFTIKWNAGVSAGTIFRGT